MSGVVLVAYATRYGSTAGVAEAVGKGLGERGQDADVRLAREVTSLDGYDAVVLGSPLYIGSMLKDATRFLERLRAELEQLPVAVFLPGPLSPDDDVAEVRTQADTALAKSSWLKPKAVEVFVGAFDPAKLRFPDSLLTKLPASPLHDRPASDARDWEAIAAWAAGLPAALGLTPGAPEA